MFKLHTHVRCKITPHACNTYSFLRSWTSISASLVCAIDPGDDAPLTMRGYDLQLCMVACEIEPSCVAINHVEKHNYCALCTKVSKSPLLHDDVMSYRFKRPRCIFPNQRPPNLDSIPGQGRTLESDMSACRKRCARLTTCVYWSYWNNGGCHLSAGGKPLKTENRVTTGKNPKLCGQ